MKKSSVESESNPSTWQLPFAALLLLLFSLFVILYSASQQDAKRTEVLVKSLRSAFGVQSRALSDLPFKGQPEAVPGEANLETKSLFPTVIQKAASQLKGVKILADIGSAWRIRIPAESLFAPVSGDSGWVGASLDEKNFPALDALGLSLREGGVTQIKIEGHVLDRELAGDASSESALERKLWSLSFDRAYAIGSYWSHRFEWSKANFEFAPKGSSQPVLDDPSSSARIELVFTIETLSKH